MVNFDAYDIGSHRLSCPACSRGPRDKTLGLTIEAGGAGVAHCFRCAFTESYHPECGAHLTTPSKPRIKAAAPTAKHDTLSDYGRDLWAASKRLSGEALDYLAARHCRIPPVDGDLRYHASLKHPSGYVGPALVALITDVMTGEPMSLHRTWIRADGRKADVDPPRLLLGCHRKQGGVIRLWPDEAVTTGLGMAEGIETALSLAWGYVPVWALIDAGNLKALPVLAGVESLVIGADNDAAGIAAADECAQRWADADREVFVTQQPQNDLNDALTEVA
jgi:putative DNA primase/helicase